VNPSGWKRNAHGISQGKRYCLKRGSGTPAFADKGVDQPTGSKPGQQKKKAFDRKAAKLVKIFRNAKGKKKGGGFGCKGPSDAEGFKYTVHKS